MVDGFDYQDDQHVKKVEAMMLSNYNFESNIKE